MNVIAKFKLDRIEDRDQAMALVKRAAAHIKAKGREQGFKDLANPNG